MNTVFLTGHVDIMSVVVCGICQRPFSREYLFEWQHSLWYLQNTGLWTSSPSCARSTFSEWSPQSLDLCMVNQGSITQNSVIRLAEWARSQINRRIGALIFFYRNRGTWNRHRVGSVFGNGHCKWTFSPKIRSSPLTTVLIVFMAMFLDGALVTTCVPIIPEIINEIRITNWVSRRKKCRMYRLLAFLG